MRGGWRPLFANARITAMSTEATPRTLEPAAPAATVPAEPDPVAEARGVERLRALAALDRQLLTGTPDDRA